MRIVVRGPQRGLLSYRIGSILAQLPWIAEFGTGVLTEDRNASAVIARSISGESHVLMRTGTHKQALRAKQRFQRELDALGESAFRDQYGLPQMPGSGVR